MQEIEHVLVRLDERIAEATRTSQRWGYFAALLRRAVRRVRLGIGTSHFENDTQMSKFVRCLGESYLRALAAFQTGGMLPRSWELAFEATQQDDVTVLQHVRLGMNALIYLDLGVAAATSTRECRFATIDHDFASLSDLLFDELAAAEHLFCAPVLLRALRPHSAGQTGEWLARQGKRLYRESTWDFGRKLSELDPAFWAVAISDRDVKVSELAWLIRTPSLPMRLGGWLLRNPSPQAIRADLEKLS